jgi:hypothetical protein
MTVVASLTPSAPTHIAPILCDKCGGRALLIRRAPDAFRREGKSELRTFECIACAHQQTVTVEA